MLQNEFPEVTLINSGGNLGFGKAHNLISRYSTEPYILFLNPDTEFLEPAHESLLDVFKRDSQIGAASCKLIDSDGTINELGIQWYPSPFTELFSQIFLSGRAIKLFSRFLPLHDSNVDGYVRKLYGGCLMVRRDVLDNVGWFDERFFMYGEDVDLSQRITSGGYRQFYLSSAKVIHTGAGASSKAPGRFAVLMQCESIAKLLQKNYGVLGRATYASAVFLRSISRLTMLGLCRLPIGLFAPKRISGWRGSHSKQLAMLKWSLGLLRPSIPK
jgi:GT2 family glycosyltransferase